MVLICCREATSGNTPPNWACRSICDATTLDKMTRSSSTTAAAVSSQEVSMPRMRMGGCSDCAVVLEVVFGILAHQRSFTRFRYYFNQLLVVTPDPMDSLPILPSVRQGAPKGYSQD